LCCLAAAGTSIGPGDLNVVAMAISGFTGDDRNVLWRDQCRSIGVSLSSPYLRALFAFLTIGAGDSYESILVSCVSACPTRLETVLFICGRGGKNLEDKEKMEIGPFLETINKERKG